MEQIVSLQRVNGRVQTRTWRCADAQALLEQLAELDAISKNTRWTYQGVLLTAKTKLAAEMVLKEVLPQRNWRAPQVDDEYLRRLEELSKQRLQVKAAMALPDLGIRASCSEGDVWFYANCGQLAKVFNAFAWRRLVVLLMVDADLGEATTAPIWALKQEMKSLEEVRRLAGIRLGLGWPWGEASRLKTLHALEKEQAELEVKSHGPHLADTLCNRAVLHLLGSQVEEAKELLEESLKMDDAIDTHIYLERIHLLQSPQEAEPDEEEEADGSDDDITQPLPVRRERTLVPDASSERRLRQLQRLLKSGARHRRRPVLLREPLAARAVEATLQAALHGQVLLEELPGVTWLLLHWGIRRKHPGFASLKDALSSLPMPSCLHIARHFGYTSSFPNGDLESSILNGLATIRCDELVREDYADLVEDLQYQHCRVLSHDDQLLVLDRRAKLLEALLKMRPRGYMRHPRTGSTRGGLMNQAPAHNLFRERVQRSQNFGLAKAAKLWEHDR